MTVDPDATPRTGTAEHAAIAGAGVETQLTGGPPLSSNLKSSISRYRP
jgi:hypothetical protein